MRKETDYLIPFYLLFFIPFSLPLTNFHPGQFAFRVAQVRYLREFVEGVEASFFPVIFLLSVCRCRKRHAS